ncbi:MAG: M42 family metallopeptidase [Anaerolineae bacterium]
MNKNQMLDLLQELVSAHAPPGDEGAIDAIIRREFDATGAEVWQDGASNLYARLPGEGPKVMVAAHKDELGMIVTDIRDDGRLLVHNIGGALPWKYGEGPVDVLTGDGGVVRGILSVGSTHTRTGPLAELRDSRALTWDLVTIFTGLTAEETRARGIHPGTRAVVARERKQIQRLGPMIATFALDDRLGLVALIAALRQAAADRLPLDLYFVATSMEEAWLLGAIRAARRIEPEVAIAVDTSPASHDTPVVVDERPVVWYGEAAYHLKADCDTLLRLAAELGFGAQAVVYNAAGSDAGGIKRTGGADRTVAFGFARDNSHGFELAHSDSLVNVTRLLLAFLETL